MATAVIVVHLNSLSLTSTSLVAVVVPSYSSRQTYTDDQIKAFLLSELTHHLTGPALPDKVICIDKMPMNSHGKP